MRRLALLAAFYFVLLQTQAFSFLDRTFYGEWDGKGGDKLTQALNLLSWIVCFLLLYLGRRNLGMVRARLTYWILIILFLLSSTIWSVAPALSIRETVLFFFLVMAAAGVATSMSADRFMAILALTSVLCGMLSIVLQAIDPGTTVSINGESRGLFSQKNVYGQAMAIGVLGCLHCLRAGVGPRWRNLVFIAVLGISITLSRSTTAMMTAVTTCGVDVFALLCRQGRNTRILASGCATVATLILLTAVIFPDLLFESLGKDATLTGRTEIWDFVWQRIQDRPILGWGYLAFFTTENPHAVELNNIVQWIVPESHNGLLEILLHLGFVGAGMYAGVIFATFRCAVKCLREGQGAVGMSALLSIITVIEFGVSEMVLLAPVQILTALFVVLSLASERALREARAKRASPESLAWSAPVRVIEV